MRTSDLNSNLKYLNRCHYYGKLRDWKYVSGAMVLELLTYTATEYFGCGQVVRIYVPTELESFLSKVLTIGDNYYVIASPYKVRFAETYRHRVDMLIQIFKEVI